MDQLPSYARRVLWKVALYAAAFALNLVATILFVIDVVRGGPLTAHGMIGVALCGLFGAFLFWEIRKPKG